MNLYSLNVILAQAAAPAATQPNPTGQFLQTGGFMVLMLVMLYFVMIRPQSKKAKEHAALLQGLRPGDKVVTSGGVVGTVVSVKERTIALRSAETKLEILKSAVSDITERGESSSSTES
jgi:preprotein translocase subunit YajC